MIFTILIAFCLVESAMSRTGLGSGPIRNTTFGQVKGLRFKDLHGRGQAFWGIPYAHPPIGEWRFKKPKYPLPWSGVRPANVQKPRCIQFWYKDEKDHLNQDESEDCLYLNVFLPVKEKNDDGKPLLGYPVMVWIHGGSYTTGGTDLLERSAASNFNSRKVVVVVIAYRLGIFGFLSLHERNCSGNFGLEDILLGLLWVRQNIRGFDGDPESVTLAGQSSGAAAISLLALSPRFPKSLAKQLMLRSGSALAPWALRDMNTYDNSVFAAIKIGCGDFRASNVDRQDFYKCLRNASVDDWLGSWQELAQDTHHKYSVLNHDPYAQNSPFFSHTFFTPVYDAYLNDFSLIDKEPKELLHNARLPVMMGYTEAESLWYISSLLSNDDKTDNRDYLNMFKRHFENIIPSELYSEHELIQQAADLVYYVYGSFANTMDKVYSLEPIVSDQNIIVPMVTEALAYVKNDVPVYTYRFNYFNSFLIGKMKESGLTELRAAAHSFDWVFLFNSITVLQQKKGDDNAWSRNTLDTEVSEHLLNTAANFILYGQPEFDVVGHSRFAKHRSIPWPRFDASERKAICIANETRECVWYNDTTYHFWHQTVPVLQLMRYRHCAARAIEPLRVEPQNVTVCEDDSFTERQCRLRYRMPFLIAVAFSALFFLFSCSIACVYFNSSKNVSDDV